MQIASLYAIILVEKQEEDLIEKIKEFQKKLTLFKEELPLLQSDYEFIMANILKFSVNGISWNIGIQLQEAIESLNYPVIFLGSEGSGLEDSSRLRKGEFDNFIVRLLGEPAELEDFLFHFGSRTKILDYCLSLWKLRVDQIDNEILLEELIVFCNYQPLKSLIQERSHELAEDHRGVPKDYENEPVEQRNKANVKKTERSVDYSEVQDTEEDLRIEDAIEKIGIDVKPIEKHSSNVERIKRTKKPIKIKFNNVQRVNLEIYNIIEQNSAKFRSEVLQFTTFTSSAKKKALENFRLQDAKSVMEALEQNKYENTEEKVIDKSEKEGDKDNQGSLDEFF